MNQIVIYTTTVFVVLWNHALNAGKKKYFWMAFVKDAI